MVMEQLGLSCNISLSFQFGLFSIDPVSGSLSIHSSPLSPSTYSLVVGVYCGKFLTYISVEVRVVDVNNPPEFDQRIYKVRVHIHIHVHLH